MTTPAGAVASASPAEARYRPALVAGTVSTALLTIASYVVAPLPAASRLSSLGWLGELRSSAPAASAAAVLICLSGFALLISWIRLAPGRDGTPRLTARQSIRLAAAWAAPLLLALPLTSQDVYSYIAVGHLQLSGIDPWTHGVDSLPDWTSLGVDPRWSATATPYGPVAVAVFAALAFLGGPVGALGPVLLARVLMTAGVGLTAIALLRIARRTNTAAGTALWAGVANPLVLLTGVLAVHVDALIAGLVAIGLASAHGSWPSVRGRSWLAWLSTTLATAIKPTSAIAYPALVRIAGEDALPARRRVAHLAWMGIGSVAASALLLAALGGSLAQWLSALFSTPQLARPLWYVPVQILTGWNLLAADEGTTPPVAKGIATIVMAVALLAAAITALWPGRRLHPLDQLALASAIFLAGQSIIWPWYLLLLVTVLAASPSLARAAPALMLGTIFFTTQSLSAGFFDTSAMPEAVVPVFNVLPGIAGVAWIGWIVAGSILRRRQGRGADRVRRG